MFHVNSLNALAGTKKFNSSKPSRHFLVMLASSDKIHLSVASRSWGLLFSSIISKLEMNLPMFHNFDRNFCALCIFCSEHLKSYPTFVSLADQNLNASAPYFLIIGRGSITFPLLLLIFSPFSSTPYPIIHALCHGMWFVRYKHLKRV